MAESTTFIVFLFVFGLAAICVELFIPGVVLGLIGACCSIGAIVMAYSREGDSHLLGHILLGSGLGFIPIVFLLWIFVLSHFFALKKQQTATASPEGQHGFLGKQGVTVTKLRPSGAARIDGRRVDVVARGVIIEPNVRIEVIAVDGNRVVVETVES